MSKRQIRKVSFWRLALRFGIIFIVIVSIIQLVFKLFKTGSLDSISESIQNGEWLIYVISHIILGAAYGIAMAWYTKYNAKKK